MIFINKSHTICSDQAANLTEKQCFFIMEWSQVQWSNSNNMSNDLDLIQGLQYTGNPSIWISDISTHLHYFTHNHHGPFTFHYWDYHLSHFNTSQGYTGASENRNKHIFFLRTTLLIPFARIFNHKYHVKWWLQQKMLRNSRSIIGSYLLSCSKWYADIFKHQ
jgi:hypothetical protein